MENVRANGQYGKRNPLFMYQRTAGYGLRAALSCKGESKSEVTVFQAKPDQSGTKRCGTMMQ